MDNDEREIRELVSTWMSATEAGDTEKVLSLMSDDVVFLVAGRPRHSAARTGRSSAARATSRKSKLPATVPSCGRVSPSS
jgi:uncharacterized protein (TIGR02246 family)